MPRRITALKDICRCLRPYIHTCWTARELLPTVHDKAEARGLMNALKAHSSTLPRLRALMRQNLKSLGLA